MRGIRLVLATALVTAALSATPAYATQCDESNPKDDCGGCEINREFSTQDLRPIVCYI